MCARYDPERHHRRSVRLKWHDNQDRGWYAVTFCTHERRCILGACENGVLVPTACGRIVIRALDRLSEQEGGATADAFAVMPNHVHLIAVLASARLAPIMRQPGLNAPASGSLGAVVGGVKRVTAARINAVLRTPGRPVWQRSYWDRVIRDEAELERFREYIAANPVRWSEDQYNDPRTPSSIP
jgi:REP element-mobilizing transposase RayT